MSTSRCYLDFNATAPLRASAKHACVAAMELVGNPSSIHREGRAARRLVEDARATVGRCFGLGGEQVTFTSGGTEAANLLLSPDLQHSGSPGRTKRLLMSATEHAAVLRGHRFADKQMTTIAVDRHGLVDLDALNEALEADGGSPALLALQAANNETGVVQPVRAAADLVHEAGGLVVCDAVQAFGRIAWSAAASGADALFVSAHKIGGPHGVGAAVLGTGASAGLALIRGGGQERGLRSGTENVAGIAGFGAAAAEAFSDQESTRLLGLRNRLEQGLHSLHDVVIFGEDAPRLPNTTCFAIPGLSAETLLMAFDLDGVALSSGSACSSGKVSRSHVLEAMGVPHQIGGAALRVSFGWSSTVADVDRFLTALSSILPRMLHRRMPAAA